MSSPCATELVIGLPETVWPITTLVFSFETMSVSETDLLTLSREQPNIDGFFPGFYANALKQRKECSFSLRFASETSCKHKGDTA